MTHRIGCIGSGKMATALMSGILQAGLAARTEVICSDPLAAQRQKVADQLGATVTESNSEVLQEAETVFLAFKPQAFPKAVVGLSQIVRPEQMIVSIMAGVRIADIRNHLPGKVVRVMPNTACLVGEMAAGFATADDVTAPQIERVKAMLECVGLAIEVSEEQLDAVTGLSGSGPAFVARLIESFIAGGIEAGLDKAVARKLALKTFSGTARLLEEWLMPCDDLVQMVSSPNGTTVAGREVLEASDVATVLKATIMRAAQRSKELGQ